MYNCTLGQAAISLRSPGRQQAMRVRVSQRLGDDTMTPPGPGSLSHLLDVDRQRGRVHIAAPGRERRAAGPATSSDGGQMLPRVSPLALVCFPPKFGERGAPERMVARRLATSLAKVVARFAQKFGEFGPNGGGLSAVGSAPCVCCMQECHHLSGRAIITLQRMCSLWL